MSLGPAEIAEPRRSRALQRGEAPKASPLNAEGAGIRGLMTVGLKRMIRAWTPGAAVTRKNAHGEHTTGNGKQHRKRSVVLRGSGDPVVGVTQI